MRRFFRNSGILAFRFPAVVAVVFVSLFPLCAETEFSVLEEKAGRFYAYREWASALAMYELMLMQQPADTCTYGRAITVQGVLDDAQGQLRMVEQTQGNGIPLDSVFATVRKEAFALGKPKIYERLLLLVRDAQPWLKRSIDIRLINYYDSRNNAPRMVELGDSLLAVNGGDVPVLHIKARGLMLQGRHEAAMETYRQVLAIDGNDVDALLNIGVYYCMQVESGQVPLASPEADEARRCLSKAYAMKPAPYLARLLEHFRQ